MGLLDLFPKGINWIRLLISLAILAPLWLTSPSYSETVCSVHDGDTLRLCNGQRVRVWGIDAPEIKQSMGKDSGRYLRNLVQGRDVSLECVGKSYKRRVCVVSIEGHDVAASLVGAGLAYDSPEYSHGKYSGLEAQAMGKRAGVWSLEGGGVRPWAYRKHLQK